MAYKRSKRMETGNDGFIALSYMFSCQIMPPFAYSMMQHSIGNLIKGFEE